MKAQDIAPLYGVVVAEYDVNFLLSFYCDISNAVEDIFLCIAKNTTPKWAKAVHYFITDVVNRVAVDDPSCKAGGRAEKYDFCYDKDFFVGYDPARGIVLRRRA